MDVREELKAIDPDLRTALNKVDVDPPYLQDGHDYEALLREGFNGGPRNRQEVVFELHNCLKRSESLRYFPSRFLDAMQREVWKHPRTTANGGSVAPCSFHDFVHKPYHIGIGASYDLVERLIKDDPITLGLYTEERQLGRGAPTGNTNASTKPQPMVPTIVSNKHNCFETEDADLPGKAKPRPAGTTAEAGLRKLQKAAREGNAAAETQLIEVRANRQSIHGACVAAGLRKPTSIPPDQRDAAARVVADLLLLRLDAGERATLLAELPKTTTKAIALALSDLFG